MLLSSQRHIQDPASQRLTWNKSPKSVLVIKKIRDASLLQPFKELCAYLMEVSGADSGLSSHPLKSGGFISQAQELRSVYREHNKGTLPPRDRGIVPLSPTRIRKA